MSDKTIRVSGEIETVLKERKFARRPSFDGIVDRFDRNGKVNSGWMVGKVLTFNNQSIQMLMFGDFATGEKYEWWSRKPVSKEEGEALAKAADDQRKEYLKTKKARQAEAALECRAFWDELPEHGSPTPYSLRKQCFELYGARADGEDLYVPLYDGRLQLQNLQRIQASGEKRFWSGGAIRGNFFCIGGAPQDAPAVIYLCEGYATGASIFEALRSRRSPSLYSEEDGSQSLHAGDGSSLSASNPPGGGAIPGASRVEEDAAHDSTENIGLSETHGQDGRGNQGNRGAADRGGQAKLGASAYRAARLGRELLTTLSSLSKQREPNARAGQGGRQGENPRKSAPEGITDTLGYARGSALRCGPERAGASSGESRNPLRAQNRPANSTHGESGPGRSESGPETLPGGIGSEGTYGVGPDYHGGPRAVDSANGDDRGNNQQNVQRPADQHGGSAGSFGGQAAFGGRSNAGEVGRQPIDPAKSRPGSRNTGTSLHAGGSRQTSQIPRQEGYLVVCAFNAGNLAPALQTLRKRWPGAKLVVCADNDAWATRPVPQRDGEVAQINPGIEAACEAARGHENCRIVFPSFHNVDDARRLTDFNDLYLCPDGPSRALSQLLEEIEPQACEAWLKEHLRVREMAARGPGATLELTHATQGMRPGAQTQPGGQGDSLVRYDRGGRAILPPASRLAQRFHDLYSDDLVKQNMDLFRYTGTHWKHLNQHDRDEMLLKIQEFCDGEASPEQLRTYAEMIRIMAEPVPEGRNIFTPDPFTANFLNGTLHVVRNCTRYYTEFKPHSRTDYLINVLPYEYKPPAELPQNDQFQEMIGRLFAGEPDEADKIRAVRQMFGACLVPLRPRLFMLFGAAGTGKSTLIKLAARLMHRENTCSVDPAEFHGFGMETMVGKLVNFITDINTSKPINDAAIKRIEDRLEVTISRKYEKDIRAPLPAIHIFGGNDIPPTLEGVSTAHDRRWTFLEFSKVFTKGSFDKDFADRVFEAGPHGVLRFALEGLEDLVTANGHFIQPASGKEALVDWRENNDTAAGFLGALRAGDHLEGGTQIHLDEKGQLLRSKLYEIYAEYCNKFFPSKLPPNAGKFYRMLAQEGFRFKKVKGERYVEGLSVGPGPNSLV